MNFSNTLRLASSIGLSAILTACGSSDENPAGSAAEFLTCDMNTVKVTGTLDGKPIDITQSSSGGGFSQLNGGEYCTQCSLPTPDPTLIDVQL
jgi:hypothetical protein